MAVREEWPTLARWVETKHNDMAQTLIVGQFTSYEQARERVGYLRALRDVREEMQRLTSDGANLTEEL